MHSSAEVSSRTIARKKRLDPSKELFAKYLGIAPGAFHDDFVRTHLETDPSIRHAIGQDIFYALINGSSWPQVYRLFPIIRQEEARIVFENFQMAEKTPSTIQALHQPLQELCQEECTINWFVTTYLNAASHCLPPMPLRNALILAAERFGVSLTIWEVNAQILKIVAKYEGSSHKSPVHLVESRDGSYEALRLSDLPADLRGPDEHPREQRLETAEQHQKDLAELQQWVNQVLLAIFNPSLKDGEFSLKISRSTVLTALAAPALHYRLAVGADRAMLPVNLAICHQMHPMVKAARQLFQPKEQSLEEDILQKLQLTLWDSLASQTSKKASRYYQNVRPFYQKAEEEILRDFHLFQTSADSGHWSELVLYWASRSASLFPDTRHISQFPAWHYGTAIRQTKGVVLEIIHGPSPMSRGAPWLKSRENSYLFLKKNPIGSSELFFVSKGAAVAKMNLDSPALFDAELAQFVKPTEGPYTLPAEQWSLLHRHTVSTMGALAIQQAPTFYAYLNLVDFGPQRGKKLYHFPCKGSPTEVELQNFETVEWRLANWLGDVPEAWVAPSQLVQLLGKNRPPLLLQQMSVFSEAWLNTMTADAILQTMPLFEKAAFHLTHESSFAAAEGALNAAFNELFNNGLKALEAFYRQHMAAIPMDLVDQDAEIVKYRHDMRLGREAAVQQIQKTSQNLREKALAERSSLLKNTEENSLPKSLNSENATDNFLMQTGRKKLHVSYSPGDLSEARREKHHNQLEAEIASKFTHALSAWRLELLQKAFEQLDQLFEQAAHCISQVAPHLDAYDDIDAERTKALFNLLTTDSTKLPWVLRSILQNGMAVEHDPTERSRLCQLIEQLDDLNNTRDSNGLNVLGLALQAKDYPSILRLLPSGIRLLAHPTAEKILRGCISSTHINPEVVAVITRWSKFELDYTSSDETSSDENRPIQNHPVLIAERFVELCEQIKRVTELLEIESLFRKEVKTELANVSHALSVRHALNMPGDLASEFRGLEQALENAVIAGHDGYLLAFIRSKIPQLRLRKNQSPEAAQLSKKLGQLVCSAEKKPGYALLACSSTLSEAIVRLSGVFFEMLAIVNHQKAERQKNALAMAILKEEKQRLELKNTGLGRKNTDLELKNTDLERKNTDLELKNTDLERKNTGLESEKADLKSRNTDLQHTVTQLMAIQESGDSSGLAQQNQASEERPIARLTASAFSLTLADSRSSDTPTPSSAAPDSTT